jgi:hypothetical protein
MNKTSIILWALEICFGLTACVNQDTQPLSTPINVLIPPNTKTLFPTQTPIVKTTPIYPIKQVIFDYYLRGGPLPFDDLVGKNYSILGLYSDRQMIVTGETFQQKILSEDEFQLFFSKIEELGFYRIESNQTHNSTDRLYDFGNNYQIKEMGSFYCVLITQEPRELCAYHPYEDFLVSEMKNILYFLDNYVSNGTTSYSPDRILMKVEVGRNPNVFNLPEKALPWLESFPPLATATNGTLYAEGKAASDIFLLLDGELTPKVFEQNGIEYTIEYVRPVLPHEVISFP